MESLRGRVNAEQERAAVAAGRERSVRRKAADEGWRGRRGGRWTLQNCGPYDSEFSDPSLRGTGQPLSGSGFGVYVGAVELEVELVDAASYVQGRR